MQMPFDIYETLANEKIIGLIYCFAIITVIYASIYKSVTANKKDHSEEPLYINNEKTQDNIENRLYYLEDSQVEFIEAYSELNEDNKLYIRTKMHNLANRV